MRKNSGFTFVELLVVITVIAVIFAVGVVSYTNISRNSRNARRRADLEAIRQSLEMCRSMADSYPNTITGSVVCTDTDNTVTMEVTPLDPKPCDDSPDGTYRYEVTSSGYTLTANCMETEDGVESYNVYNP